MRHLLICLFLLAALTACAPTVPAAAVTPSPGVTPSPAPAATPVPPDLLLADFPLAVGTVWTYTGEIGYSDPADPAQVLTWKGTRVDTVTGQRSAPDGKIVFTVQETLDPAPPEGVWRQPGSFEYTLAGDGVYMGGQKVYQWPLEDNLMWEAFEGFDYEVFAQRTSEVETPYGKLNGCYIFGLATNPDTNMSTFCPGIGFAAYHYSHHGTLQEERFSLSAFTPGE